MAATRAVGRFWTMLGTQGGAPHQVVGKDDMHVLAVVHRVRQIRRQQRGRRCDDCKQNCADKHLHCHAAGAVHAWCCRRFAGGTAV